MTTATVPKMLHFDWLGLRAFLRKWAPMVFAFALGGWCTSIADKSAQLPYKDRATANFEQVQKVAGPNPVASIDCTRAENKVLRGVATQAIVSNFVPAVPVPSLTEVRHACPSPQAAAGLPAPTNQAQRGAE
jgi:hypothetical protein